MNELRRHRLLRAGRPVVVLLLAAALLLPGSEPGEPALAIVLDGGTEPLPEHLRASIAAALETWPGSRRVIDRAVAPDLKSRLEQALWQLAPGQRGALLLVSDGHWSAETASLLRRAAAAGLAIYWLPSERPGDPPRVLAMRAASRARPGEALSVAVTTEPLSAAKYEIAVYGNGELLAQTAADASGRNFLTARMPDSGAVRFDAVLLDARTLDAVHRLSDAAVTNVVGPPALLVVTDGPSPLGDALAQGGWSVDRVGTRAFPASAGSLGLYGAVVIEDVPADAVPDATWHALAAAVRERALGLLVLGGPRSFGLGGYRGSALERLLPVVSEPPERERPVSLVFLVDVSGSMGRTGNAGLTMARAAVQHTARSLVPADRVGLVVFDVEARVLLPVDSRADHAAAIEAAWPEQPGGGTSVQGALEAGLAALAAGRHEQKIVVLVSDGRLTAEDGAAVTSRLAGSDVDFIALLLPDEGAGRTAPAIAPGARRTILSVADVHELPALMRAQVESRRPALAAGPVAVAPAAAPDLVPEAAGAWPPLDAFLVTRPRAGAHVLLAGPDGDPVLAEWTAGAGRVAVLTGGLGTWAGPWLAWRHWPLLASRLIERVAVRDPADVRIERVDGPDGAPGWVLDTRTVPLSASAALGDGTLVALTPEALAPGRYALPLPAPHEGIVRLTWETADGVYRHVATTAPGAAGEAGDPAAAALIEAGVVEPWSAAAGRRLSPPPLRRLASAAALLLFLVLLAAERAPLAGDAIPRERALGS